MGILDGKRSSSPASSMDSLDRLPRARSRRSRAPRCSSPFGRALNITKRIAKRLPQRAAGARARRHRRRPPRRPRRPGARARRRPRRRPALDRVRHPRALLGGNFMTGPWEDVAQAVQVSAYSLKSLAVATPAADGARRLDRRAHLRRDVRLAGVRLDGRGQGGARVDHPLPRPRPRSRGHPLQPGLGRPDQDDGRQVDPGLRGPRVGVEGPRPARLGRDRPRARRAGRVRAAVATGSRPPPARSCTSTAASTPWGSDRPQAFGSVRTRDLTRRAARPRGPEPLLPARRGQAHARRLGDHRGADETGAALRAPDRAAHDPAGRAGHRASGSGSRCARSSGWCARIAARGRHDAPRRPGAARPPTRPARRRLPVAQPRPRPGAGRGGRATRSTRCPTPDVEAAVSAAAERVAAAEPGAGPTTITPQIPVVAVTGTNGKTTTSRMIAHIARTGGLRRRLVQHRRRLRRRRAGRGRRLLRPRAAPAACSAHRRRRSSRVTETARGGILLKGIGVTRNDVSVVTNVTADHLGLQGIDTVDQLAEVKAVVPRITRKDGWAVLNGDDPRVLRDAAGRSRRSRGSSAATPTRRPCARCSARRRSGHHRHRRLDHRARARRRPRPAGRAASTCR